MSFGKKNILTDISSKAHISNETSKKLLERFLELIKSNSKNKIVKVYNFGSFYTRITPKRLGRNPKTKEEFIILQRKKLYFKSSSKIRTVIN